MKWHICPQICRPTINSKLRHKTFPNIFSTLGSVAFNWTKRNTHIFLLARVVWPFDHGQTHCPSQSGSMILFFLKWICLINPFNKKEESRPINNEKLGENHRDPLSGTHNIPHMHLCVESLVEVAHWCLHFSPSSAIAIPSLWASESDFAAGNHRTRPLRRGLVKSHEDSCQSLN